MAASATVRFIAGRVLLASGDTISYLSLAAAKQTGRG